MNELNGIRVYAGDGIRVAPMKAQQTNPTSCVPKAFRSLGQAIEAFFVERRVGRGASHLDGESNDFLGVLRKFFPESGEPVSLQTDQDQLRLEP